MWQGKPVFVDCVGPSCSITDPSGSFLNGTHEAVVNSEGLRAIGIARGTSEMRGAHIELDAPSKKALVLVNEDQQSLAIGRGHPAVLAGAHLAEAGARLAIRIMQPDMAGADEKGGEHA